MIKIEHVTKRFGDKVAVDDVSFTIQRGEILGFLGRNGAGKTTTMNIVTGYISSTEGKVTIDGADILEEPRAIKRRIGYLPEQPPLYMDMTVLDYLAFTCDIKEVRKKSQKGHIDDICDLVKIADVQKRLIKNLSKGYRQRVGLAQALVGNPEFIIMDEPTVGLDPRQIIEIRALIRDLGQDHTVVLSSHILPEVQDVCERVVIINKGKIVAEDKLENLTRGIGESASITVRIAGPAKQVQEQLHGLEGVRDVTSLGQKEAGSADFIITTQRANDIRRNLFNTMARSGWPILMLKPMDLTLEDVFIQLTGEKEVS